MQTIKSEIAALESTKPPKNFSVDNPGGLENIKTASDESAIHLFIDRIDAAGNLKKEKTVFHMQST